MNFINKLFEAHRFPTFWIILISFQYSIILISFIEEIFFFCFGFISLFSFSIWVEDIEAARRQSLLKKNIITFLIAVSGVLTSIGFITSSDPRIRVVVYFIIMLVIHLIYLIATIYERTRHC